MSNGKMAKIPSINGKKLINGNVRLSYGFMGSRLPPWHDPTLEEGVFWWCRDVAEWFKLLWWRAEAGYYSLNFFNWGDGGEKVLLPALSLGEKWTLWSHLTDIYIIWTIWSKSLFFNSHNKRLAEDGRFPIHGEQTVWRRKKIKSYLLLSQSGAGMYPGDCSLGHALSLKIT